MNRRTLLLTASLSPLLAAPALAQAGLVPILDDAARLENLRAVAVWRGGEEIAARGYGGFTFHASPEVTLEEDLQRRDLTINAIAEDEQGQLIDPYGGQRDLQARLLRHVSPAFAEDPLRVLRVARFAARYAELGFRIADETGIADQPRADAPAVLPADLGGWHAEIPCPHRGRA